MAGIGFQVTSEVAAGVLMGWLFDYWRGTGHVGVLVGSIAGIAVALWSLIRNTLRLNSELEKAHPAASRGKPLQPASQDESEDRDDGDDWNNDDFWDDEAEQPKPGGGR